jgi:hypothetical protein
MDTKGAIAPSTPTLHFSLRHVLIAVGAACVVLAPAHYFDGVYLFSIAFSIALVFICVIVYRVTAVGAVGVAFLGLFVGLFLAMVFFTFGVHAFFNLLVCIALWLAQVRVRTLATALFLTMLAVYGFAIYSGLSEMQQLMALKAANPFKSLADRLEFEKTTPSISSSSHQPIYLAPFVAFQLNEQDKQHHAEYFDRAWALKELHENTAMHFARAAGFGVMRMPSIRREIVRLKPRTPIQLPAAIALDPANAAKSQLPELHQNALFNFVDPNRIGYVPSRDQVAGFESHRLSSLQSNNDESSTKPTWKVNRLELVSLLRHTEPCVYVAKAMPAMDKLAEVPTRPLNRFEQTALPQLTTQENVVVDQQSEHIQMLGALRAGKSCLECHEVDRGKLLGAFSYEFVPLAHAGK